jgi:hypothetical protein
LSAAEKLPESAHIRLASGELVLVDAIDYEWASRLRWCAGSVFRYAVRKERQGDRYATVYLHRQITGAGPGQIVDHISGDPHDCRRSNLRVTDRVGNARNMTSSPRQKAGGRKGVTLRPDGKWQARIKTRVDGVAKQISLGRFYSEDMAARAYDAAARFHFGDHASLNFPADEAWALEKLRQADADEAALATEASK